MSKFPTPQAFTAAERPAIPLYPVESSQIAAIGYDPSTCVLAVQFKGGKGAIYHYPGVPQEVFSDFMDAESKGQFFAQHVKPLPFDKYSADPVAAVPVVEKAAPATSPLSPEQEVRAAEEAARGLATVAKQVVIKTDDDYRAASVAFAQINQMKKDLEAKRVSITGPINQSLKIINDGFKRAAAEFDAAQAPYSHAMLAFQKKQEDDRREAERLARAEEERLREEARQRAAEEERHMREVQERADAARAEASATDDPVAAMLAEDEANRRETEAADARARAEAEIRASARVEVLADVPVRTTGAGSRVLKPWKYKIVDASLIPDEFWIVDEMMLANYAKTMKDKAKVAGVEFFQDMKIGGA